MELWLDAKRIAYTTESNGTTSFSLDVWEDSSLVGLPFKRSAFFVMETDARFYLAAKYPQGIERLAAPEEEAVFSPSMARPTPPYDLRDDAAWRKYREDSSRYRMAISEDAA